MLQPSINSPEPKSERTPETFDIRPAAVQDWVANLPLADVSKTCGLVFNALAETNTRGLAPQQRFKLLETLRAPVDYLDDALTRHFTNACLPLPPQTSKIAALLYGLQLEIAKGYQHIVDALLGLEGLRQDFGLLATAMQRALAYYGRALLTGYQTYRPDTSGLWRAVHALYEGAERKGVASTLVKDPYCLNGRVSAVDAEYKQILLLALADPLRLSQDDMQRLARLLAPWAARCRLAPIDRALGEDACIVDLSSDRPPMHRPHCNGALGPRSRCLDTATLVAELRRDATRPPPAVFEAPLPRGLRAEALWRGLVNHLLRAWGSASKRVFVRNEGALAEMQWLAGLTRSHAVLSEDEDSDVLEVPFAFGGQTPRTLQRRARAQHETVNAAMIINESANGACLRWLDALPGRVRVDEVLVLRHAHQPGWGVGAVRWLKTLSHRGIELGVEMLGPEVIPVMVRRHEEGESEREYLKSLYLPEVEALRRPASLLVPATFFEPDDVVSLRMRRHSRLLRLDQVVESTRVYTRFLFSIEA